MTASSGPSKEARGSSSWRFLSGYARVRTAEQRSRSTSGSLSASAPAFKPLGHRTVVLAFLTAVVLSLIGVLEYSIYVLPSASLNTTVQPSNSTIAKRQDGSGAAASKPDTQSLPLISTSRAPVGTPKALSTQDSHVATHTPTSTTKNYISPAATTVTTAKGAPGAPGQSVYRNTPGATTSTTTLGPVATENIGQYHPLGGTTVTTGTIYASPESTNYDIGGGTTVTLVSPGQVPAPGGTSVSALGVMSVTISNSVTLSLTPVTMTASDHTYTYWQQTTDGVTYSFSQAPVNPQSAVASVLTSPPANAQPTAEGLPATGPSSDSSNLRSDPIFQSNLPLKLVSSPQNYFVGVYLPMVIAVILRLLVDYVYRCTKLMDPFFQLSNANGALLKNFFWADFLGADRLRAPLQAFQSQRWMLLWMSLLYAFSQLLTPFASELMIVRSGNYKFVEGNVSGYVRGDALWVDPTIVRILQAFLAFIAVQLISMGFLLKQYKLLLPSNPAKIATMASLVAHPATARAIAPMDQYASKNAILAQYGEQRYRLENYVDASGNAAHGIVPMGPLAPPPTKETLPDLPPPVPHKRFRSMARRNTINLLFMTAAALTLLGVIAAYYVNSSPTSFEAFMDSQSFGPRFILSALALVLKSPLLSLWARATASIPYSRLATRPRPAALDIRTSVPVPLTPLGSIAYALRRREWYTASLAIVAGVAIEILLILLPGVPFNSDELWDAARASWLGSMACLGLILLVAIAGWVRLATRRGSPVWPRPPTTFGAVVMYVAGSSMARDRAGQGLDEGARFEFSRRLDRWVVDYVDDGAGVRHALAKWPSQASSSDEDPGLRNAAGSVTVKNEY